ncbi:MAG: 2-oxoacid:acceptor oxidoreductase family protein [Fervidobacterium sp.]|nr:2-oxoacid:acceptor oxidoreductase family protein [Fervidobacterium sp.]
MKTFSIYMVGVGGQGIGTLSEIMIRAVDYSGQNCIGVDTHGLAQRGGVVSSHLKIGDVNSPLVMPGDVDLVIALERHEAARGMSYLKSGGTIVYYDTSWQPLPVRLGKEAEITTSEIEEFSKTNNIKIFRVHYDLPDARMQNIAILATIAKYQLIPQVEVKHYLKAMEDLMSERIFEPNKELFLRIIND